jgi:hypothetical protein
MVFQRQLLFRRDKNNTPRSPTGEGRKRAHGQSLVGQKPVCGSFYGQVAQFRRGRRGIASLFLRERAKPAAFYSLSAVARRRVRIPYGNKDVAMKFGARYGSAGWYAPPGVDLSTFGERGWL